MIYHLEEKTQKAYQCIEGSGGVTAMALSENRRNLAVAEKSDKNPVVTIYRVDDDRSGNEERKTDAKILKRRKYICSMEINQHKSFISMAFCPLNDKILATLSSVPDQKVYLWQIDKQRYIAQQNMSFGSGNPIGLQVSFSNIDPNVVLVTGSQAYRYYTRKEDQQILTHHNKTISKKEYSYISTNYTAHCWLEGGRILVGTDQGQIVLCDPTGEVRRPLNDYPGEGFEIQQMIKYKNAFIVVGDKGQMMVYSYTGDPNNPFQMIAALPNPFDEKMSEE